VMEHAERLCDRIILMSTGRVVFDGSIEDALARAPRRLIIQSSDAGIEKLLSPFATSIDARDDGALTVYLKPDKEAFAALEACVKAKMKLTRFEPKNPSLHEAFVTMVGEDEAAKMHAGVFA